MKKFTLELLLFFSPALFILVSYIIIDPYCVIHARPSNAINSTVSDYTNTNTYLKTYSDSNYCHFVFGNSRTIGFQNTLEDKYPKSFFDFHNPGESIINIKLKLGLIDDLNQKIESCLILLDNDLIKNYNNSSPYYQGPEYLHHPKTGGYSYIQFHKNLLEFYLTDFFWFKRMDYAITKTYKTYMSDCFQKPGNSKTYSDLEKWIIEDSLGYYETNINQFKLQKSEISSVLINKEDLEYLKIISELFKKHNTKFNIVFGPNYDQISINPATLQQLESIFGEENIANWSGVNFITNNAGYYYESSHYRPVVGEIILNQATN
jgi:hypothetical protein